MLSSSIAVNLLVFLTAHAQPAELQSCRIGYCKFRQQCMLCRPALVRLAIGCVARPSIGHIAWSTCTVASISQIKATPFCPAPSRSVPSRLVSPTSALLILDTVSSCVARAWRVHLGVSVHQTKTNEYLTDAPFQTRAMREVERLQKATVYRNTAIKASKPSQ